MVNALLDGFRALDLTDETGFICGKILATMGVETVKVEKPGGDPNRRIPPYYRNKDTSLYWLAYNTDKRSITLNLETDQGRELFRRLVEKVDFVLESFTPGYLDNLELGYDDLCRINPGIIMTSITPFGQKGPYAQYKGCELIASAMSGVMLTNGDPDRPPLREGPDSIYYRSNAAAALGTVMAHFHRRITGEGQQVDVSLQEVAASRTTTNLVVWEFDKRLIKRNSIIRTVGARATQWLWPCKDGYVFWAFMGGPIGAPANRALSKWMDYDGMENPLNRVTNWEEFDMATVPKEVLDAQQEAIRKFFLNHTKREITDEGLQRRINACAVNNPADVLEYPQLGERGFWTNLEHPELGTTLSYPKYFFLSSETENFVKHRAPLVGEDNEDIYAKELGLSGTEISRLKENGII
ncbi:MAG TPA: CoA transferase [Dehalococcoidales bacterium]|nr:CoA transferase [Dehalococcoidales bacterium]